MSAKSKEMVSIWPGYVAAIASLVLSLLLLLAILALAMTQVGAAGYRLAFLASGPCAA
jgi:hypothetical protein